MEDLQISYQDAIYYLIIWNIIAGIFFGSFPLLAGIRLRNRKYGVFGLVGSIVGGALAGIILSFPIAIIFTWLILRSIAVPAGAVDEANESTSEKTVI
jgi:hypothetical protein